MTDALTISDLRDLRLNSQEWQTFIRAGRAAGPEEGEHQSMVEVDLDHDDLEMLVLAGLLERVYIGDEIVGPWLDQWDFTPAGEVIVPALLEMGQRHGLEKILAIISHDDNS
jgi:hypothetical protein